MPKRPTTTLRPAASLGGFGDSGPEKRPWTGRMGDDEKGRFCVLDGYKYLDKLDLQGDGNCTERERLVTSFWRNMANLRKINNK
jgi:hypothetical protein